MFININDNQFKVDIARTPEEKSKGMMNQKFNSKFNGLLFLMDGDEHCFWMKNCIIKLDIIFIRNMEIVNIFHNCEPCVSDECEHFCDYGDLVLELKGGTCEKLNINVGDKIELKVL